MLGCADLAARGDGCTEEVGVPCTMRLRTSSFSHEGKIPMYERFFGISYTS